MTTRSTHTLSMAAIGEFPLKKLSAEIARLLRNAPHFGDTIAEIIEEESVRRIQGRDSLVTAIPIASASERMAVVNWASLVRLRFEQWAAEAPEFSDEFLAAVDFLKQVEALNR